MNLQSFQLDLAARLEVAPAFANVPILIFRPRAAMTATQIQDRINASLGALSEQNGKAGLCCIILMPLLSTKEQELPGPYLHLKCTVRVQENVLINMGANGTQIACEDAAIAVAQALHLWTPGGVSGIVRCAMETITPNLQFEGKVTYDVAVESELELEGLPKTATPMVSSSEGTATIACEDETAAIYYTLDGSAPWSGNGSYPTTGILYTGPFRPDAGRLVRAAAFNPGKLGSDTAWLQL